MPTDNPWDTIKLPNIFITLNLPWDNDRIVTAEVIGDLALDFGDEWEIYHVPTLTRFSEAVPINIKEGPNDKGQSIISFDYTKPQLLSWMKKVQEQYPTAWQMLRQLTPENYADNGDSAKDIIKKWCLSVPVI